MVAVLMFVEVGSVIIYQKTIMLTNNNHMAFRSLGLQGTSDLDTITSDRINMEALLASRDYFTNTQSDLATTGADLVGTGQSDHLLDYPLGRSADYSQSGGLRQTMGSTSDMSLSPGLTQTLERSEEELNQSKRLMTFSVDSDTERRTSGRYPDSLEGTGGDVEASRDFQGLRLGVSGEEGGAGPGRSGPLQMSVMIPSVGEESEGTEGSADNISELDLG